MGKLSDILDDIWWWRFRRLHLNPKKGKKWFKAKPCKKFSRKIKKTSKGDMSDERNIQRKRD